MITRDDPNLTITLTWEEEYESIRGNVDDESEKWIRDELNRGNEWAWFCAKVTVKWHGLTADDYLGCCSYRSEKDFRDDTMGDMVNNCIAMLNEQVNKLSGSAVGLARSVVRP